MVLGIPDNEGILLPWLGIRDALKDSSKRIGK